MPKPKKVQAKKPVEEEVIPEQETSTEPDNTPKLETVVVCKDANGKGGRKVQGYISEDGKEVKTLEGVTYTI